MEFGELEFFQHAGLNCAISQNQNYNGRVFHNGYVQLPPGHPWHGTNWDTCFGLECPGGVTYGESGFPSDSEETDVGPDWVLGFDTNHYGDNEYTGSYAVVRLAIEKMAEACVQKQKEQEEAFDEFVTKWRSENSPEREDHLDSRLIYFVNGNFACWCQGDYRARLFVYEAREAGFQVEIRS